MKCDNCLNSRKIISENGLHSKCCLSDKAAMNCFIGKKNRKIMVSVSLSNEKIITEGAVK